MDIFQEFCQQTTVHGLSFAIKQNLKPLKITWFLVVLLGFFGLLTHMSIIINSYLQYKSTESTYQRRNGYQFPDVTICNLNGISLSNLQKAAESSFAVKTFYEAYLNFSADNGCVNYKNELSLYLRDISWALDDDIFSVGHRLEDLVIKCSFEQERCKEDDFVLFEFPYFLNCYTFKRGRDKVPRYVRGIPSGLSFTVYLEPDDSDVCVIYDDHFLSGNTKGIRVFIAGSNTLAAVGNAGYDIVPGHSTSIGFDITEHNRLSEPYSECRYAESLKLQGDVTYSYAECRNMCIHDIVIENCGCFPTRYRARRRTKFPSCAKYIFTNATKSAELLKCERGILDGIEARVDFRGKCNCFWPCVETTYSTSYSHAVWPERKSLDSFISNILESHPNKTQLKAYQYYQKLKAANASDDDIYNWVTSQFLRLNIYANSDITTVKEQILMYTITDLLCQIGGCLGLWVGMSIITTVEVLDLWLRLFGRIFSKGKIAD